ncbi:MAG TPA: hypothetical protein VIM57_01085 [Luteolibacter sp.]
MATALREITLSFRTRHSANGAIHTSLGCEAQGTVASKSERGPIYGRFNEQTSPGMMEIPHRGRLQAALQWVPFETAL